MRPKFYFTFICSRQGSTTQTPLAQHKGQFFVSVAQQPKSGLGHLIVEVSRTHRHKYTLGWTPLNERSARHQGHCVHNTQQTQETNIHAFSGIRTRNPSNREAADLCLTPHGYRDRL